ncbi:phosphoribosylamine--glycine ligase [Pseudoroseomonas rhizosphaerae]|uniref:Phosphoribosylamine--glycine ligase n=1 Tax=Teichococcus rhizosphaerae TaxID=1335062 RepID=A0A2C7A9E3_9PROT|nr:phosphoribosylamine--glycine ligase [Pseudoroseomonas rhizosphaerae]PHK95010.1 phosphoribosylamine--glycine ligase [Pseudoroseomonas rhizosphaerae]
MMRPIHALLLLPLLAACAGRPPAPPAPQEPPGHAACRAEARNDPAVLALGRQDNPLNWGNRDRVQNDLRVAELRAFRDCLRRNGLAAPGGVEPLR